MQIKCFLSWVLLVGLSGALFAQTQQNDSPKEQSQFAGDTIGFAQTAQTSSSVSSPSASTTSPVPSGPNAPGSSDIGNEPKQDVRAQASSAVGFAERDPRYKLRPGDVLQLTFSFTPEFNQVLPVQPDGFVSLRDIGDLKVLGMTLPQVRQSLGREYGTILNRPVIAVALKEFERPYFIVSGQVGHPGKYELRGDTTVTEALAMAGGLTEASKHSQVVLYRRQNDRWHETKVIDVKRILAKNDIAEDLSLQPGDMLYVPQNTSSKIKKYIPIPGVGMGITP